MAAYVFYGFRSVASGICKVLAVTVANDKYSVKVAIYLEAPRCLLYELYGTRLTLTLSRTLADDGVV